MRRFGVSIACANLGVLLTVAWWLGWPATAPSGAPVDAVLIDDFRPAADLSQASFHLYGEAAQAELNEIFARQNRELWSALQLWLLKYGGDRTTGQKSPR